MATPAIERLRDIKTLPQLVSYLRDELDWPISSNNAEDITFDYEPAELGLDKETAVKVKEIKQLRPLTGNQPWGIFFVNFEKKQLPVMVMRRILRSLVFKKRTTPGKSDRQAWHASDLLFISAYGEEHDRAITFAHFIEDEELGGLAELRVLGWDDDDTPLKYDYVAHTLQDKFRWRGDFEGDADAWRKTWRNAFELRHREVITTSKQLALSLAALAKKIRSRVRSILRYEDGLGQIRKLQAAFRKALIHDLSDDDFADMYAQTITYGLFSAAVSRPAGVHGENIIDMVPVTNPFLRDMLETFLNLSGRKGKIDFDELGIQEVTSLLNSPNTHLNAVLRDFDNRNPQEDPVIHFYELFLAEYDRKKKVQRGVFYTPKPVVSYIVRSVHELLQSEFKLEDGLADTTTWGEMVRRNPGLKLPNLSDDPERYQPLSESEPFVQILDPAVGTATFLVEAIDVIHRHLQTKWRENGFAAMPELPATSFPRQPSDFSDYWNQYVAFSLLPRLHGYELMMAPYAIAHMKIGLKLWETGYRFGTNERARVYLTNSLEPPQDFADRLAFDAPALAHEAKAVNEIKRKKRFTVVIGNPPYSRASANKGQFIEQLIEVYKAPVREERNIQPLSDDYIKFVRLSEHLLNNSGEGVHGMITNNTYLSGRIHRGMRKHLANSFKDIRVVNLHGSRNVNFLGARGAEDENVFDILQGVGIATLSKRTNAPSVRYGDLIGTRQYKYDKLTSTTHIDSETLAPAAPYFLWIPRTQVATDHYASFVPLTEIFGFHSVSGKPGDDNLLISLRKDEVLLKLEDFRRALAGSSKPKLTEAGRNLAARSSKKAFDPSIIVEYAYRPFDTRFTYYDADIWTRAVRQLNACIDGTPVLLTTKIVKDPQFSHVFVSRQFADVIFLSATSSVNCFSFPIHVRARSDRPEFVHLTNGKNIRRDKFEKELGIALEDDAIFSYCYAVLHSPRYRERYFEQLQYDFPRLPLTGNLELFRAVAKIGGELVGLHLLESPKLDKPRTEYIGGRNPEVEKVSWSKNTVWIDKAQTTGFRGVPEDVWNFHIGGYQVCEKWLKDRKGRTLSKADIAHYHKIAIALHETIRLMAEVDKVIEKHGGWAGAFALKTASKKR
jgi:hypothetical protein